MIFFIILLLLIVLIINIIISNSKNENFGSEPNRLIYLYNSDSLCTKCKDFNNTWSSIENEVNANPFYYNFVTAKYNIDDESKGQSIAKDNKINTPPAIIYKSDNNYKIYKDKSKDMTSILEWAAKI
jgi:hypothetical protein